MTHTPLTPVFAGLRIGLHVLVAALMAVTIVSLAGPSGAPDLGGLAVAAVFCALYLAGSPIARLAEPRRRRLATVWVLALTAVWVLLLTSTSEAAYLVFPLFFLYLHVLPGWRGPALVVASTAIAIVAIGLRDGFTVGGVIGPLVGAGVALLIGLGYAALARESAEREELVRELLATRDRLAATEREQGVLAERARLAREIHDTVAQGLSSIQMLLHAAERDGDLRHVRLARETAADGLAEARRFVRELTSPALDEGLPAALRRLAATQASSAGLEIEVRTPDGIDLPMGTQSALLRVAQGAVANVIQHAGATQATLELDVSDHDVQLLVRDDGVGFDPNAIGTAASDSFGLEAIRERARQLDGDVVVDAAPGRGTTLRVILPREAT